jgi:hypothetical protein
MTVYFTARKMPYFEIHVHISVSFPPLFPSGNILCKARPYGTDLGNIPL